MKLRTWVVTALVSLFAVSLAYAAPTTLTADDSNTLAMDDTSTATGATNPANEAANVGGLQNDDMAMLNDNDSNNLALDNNNNDDISADTATGDDDY